VNQNSARAAVGRMTYSMTDGQAEVSADLAYAINIANSSYDWYRTRAIRSRKSFRISETTLLVVSAAVPAAAAIEPHNAVPPAILGAIVVILSGLRAVFH
jgi:hypothetical protein